MPLYEYVCRTCGSRTERMRKVAERLEAAECACGGGLSLVMSSPARVSGSGAAGTGPAGEGCGPGGCCGGRCGAGSH